MSEPMEDDNPPPEAQVDEDDKLLADRLLEGGAKLQELAGDRSSTSLHIAAEIGNKDVVTILLKKLVASDLLTKDHEGDTPLHTAAGNFEIFELLFQANPDSNVRNGKDQTLLHYAAGKNCLKVVEFLLEKNVALKTARDKKGATPFHFAARSGSDVSVLERLMNDIDEKNEDGLTALHYAARNGRTHVVEWLLDKGASVSASDLKKKNTPLHWAAINQSPESTKLICAHIENAALPAALLKKGHIEKASPAALSKKRRKKKEKTDDIADVLCVKNVDGKLSVDLAHDFHNKDAVTTICKSMITCRVFMAHHDSGTLLHYAAAYGTEEDVQWVLNQIRLNTVKNKDGKDKNYKDNVNRMDSKGQNAFHWAAREGNTSVIQTLKNNHVNPWLEDTNNRTPLCLAIIGEKLVFAEMLLDCLGESESMRAKELKNVINIWIGENQKIVNQQLLIKFNAIDKQMMGNCSLEEMPPIYKALCARKQEVVKFIHKQSKGLFEFVNSKDKMSGRTALHWATILKQKKIVSFLCTSKGLSEDVAADIVDFDNKTPLDYATDVEIMTELRRRPEVASYVDNLYRDRQVYVDISNAILGGAGLIGSITFERWIKHPNDEGMELFWVCNSLAFISAIATVLAGACAMFPVQDSDITKAVTSIRQALKTAAFLLVISIGFILLAFIAAWYHAWPLSKYPVWIWGTLFAGNGVCGKYMWKFIGNLFKIGAVDPPTRTKLGWNNFFKTRAASPVVLPPEDSPLLPLLSTHIEEEPALGDSLDVDPAYRPGTRYEYIPWDDGLDDL